MDNFNINDIEEVSSKPKIKTRNRKNNNNRAHNLARHNRRRAPIFISKEFGFTEKLLITILILSMIVLFISFLINIFLTMKGFITPRIFFPSIIIFILTSVFSGAIIGTYVNPPDKKDEFNKEEIFIMRMFSPIIMLIISFIFLFFSISNIKTLKLNIKKAQNICESYKGLSMDEIYSKLNKTYYDLNQYKYDLIYIFNQKLLCVPIGKCIKLKSKQNEYICNSDEFIKSNDFPEIKCQKIHLNNIEDSNYYNSKQDKDAKLFVENCKEVSKNILTVESLFNCESKNDLKSMKFIPNEKNISIVEEYFDKKLEKYNSDMIKTKEITNKYENSIYTYDLECYNHLDYLLTYISINIYYIIYYLCSFSWIYLGFNGIYQLIKFLKKDVLNNDINIGNENRILINDINSLDINEDNSLINNKNERNKERYIELSESPK